MNVSRLLRYVAAGLASLALTTAATAGSIFITGHDPLWHSGLGGNFVGAANLAKTGIDYARNGSAADFLFIESLTTPVPAGNAREAQFLNGLGYTGQYDVMDGAALSALSDFRATLNSYSAIVIASDHGGMLTGAELGFLNSHASDIIDYLNAGGGLFAGAQSNAQGLITGHTPFGFLPFLVSSTSFQAAETGNTVTAFGASLGLVNSDVNGNFSHNFFSATGGMTAVDLFNGNAAMPLTLATRSNVTPQGVPDSSATLALSVLGLAALFAARRRLA